MTFSNFLKAKGRTWLAIVLVFSTIGGITLLSIVIINRDHSNATLIFNALLPTFATWVGTILAFYFGKENFEAAADRYDHIIDRLTPDILDNVPVRNIMITKKTMVYKTMGQLQNKLIIDLINFVDEVKKSRLPILNDDGSPAYIVHTSTLKDYEIRNPGKTFNDLITDHKSLLEMFNTAELDDILENVISELKQKPNVKDVYVVEKEGHVAGWLTDTLIMRFISSKTQVS